MIKSFIEIIGKKEENKIITVVVVAESLSIMAEKISSFDDTTVLQVQVVVENEYNVFFLDGDINCRTKENIYKSLVEAVAEKMVRDTDFRQCPIKF